MSPVNRQQFLSEYMPAPAKMSRSPPVFRVTRGGVRTFTFTDPASRSHFLGYDRMDQSSVCFAFAFIYIDLGGDS